MRERSPPSMPRSSFLAATTIETVGAPGPLQVGSVSIRLSRRSPRATLSTLAAVRTNPTTASQSAMFPFPLSSTLDPHLLSASSPHLLISSSPLTAYIHRPLFHHESDPLEGGKILFRISLHGNDVGQRAGLDHSQPTF